MFHDFPAYRLASGEKDVVKMFFQQTGILGTPTGNDGNVLPVEAVAYDPSDDLACIRRVSAGFQDYGIPGGDGVDKRIKCQ